MKNKLYHHLGTLSMLWLFFLLLSFNASAQDLTDAQRLERCQNNKNRLTELEKQSAIVNAELRKIPEKKEIDDARDNMIFIKKLETDRIDNVKKLSEKQKLLYRKILSLYNFDIGDCYDNSSANFTSCIVGLYTTIVQKIDKGSALLLQRPALVKQKQDIDKQIASHRNNIIALGCDKTSFNGNTPNLAGTWKGLNWVYEITQNGTAFSWTITNDAAYNESAKGNILDGNKIKATWTNKNGTDTGTGNIITDSNGKAIEIQWLNGVVFTRK